jgi:hypothetical protein
VNAPRKPDLDQLVSALTADGRPDELAGRDAALAAFRATSRRGAAGGAASRPHRMPFRRPLTAGPKRLAAVGATLVVAATGLTAAAYTQALPGPAQDLAHTVFAGLGVPKGQLAHTTGSSTVTTASSKAPAPRPGNGYHVAVAVSRTRLPVGGKVEFTGRVTDRGRAAASVRVRLFERLAGSNQFELVGTGTTGPLGGFRLSSPPLTATAVFRVVGPDDVRSAAVRVTVAHSKVTVGAADVVPGPAPTGQQ